VRERQEYVLPARFDDTPLPGLLSDMHAVDLRGRTPEQFAAMIAAKLAALGIVAFVPQADARYPLPLPESLRTALESPHPNIRIAAVTELGEWLVSGDPARAATARRRLREIADTGIPRMAQTARALLDTGTTAELPTPAVPHVPSQKLPGGPIQSMARRAAQVSLDDPRGVASVLGTPQEPGDPDAIATLLARDPAAHVGLDHPEGVGQLLEKLREAGASDAVQTLAARAANAGTFDPSRENEVW